MSIKTAELPLSRKAIRLAVGAFFFMQGFTFASWAGRIPHIQQQLQLSEAGLGSVLLALPFGLLSSLPLSDWVIAKLSSKRIAIFAAMTYSMLLPLIGLVEATWQLAGLLFIFGFAGNLVNISINTQAIGVEDLYGRSIMSSFHGLWSLAGFLSASLGTYLVSLNTSPFVHFCISSFMMLLLLMVAYKNILPQDENQDTKQPLFVKPDKLLLKLGVIGFCGMICEGTMFDWSGVYFKKVVESPQELTTLGYVAFMCTMAGGRFIGDWLATRFGTRKVIQLNGVLIASGLLISVAFPHIITATLGFMMVGMGVSTIVPLVYGLAGKSKTMSAGMALAAVSSVSFFGFLFGPPLIGFIAEAASLRFSFAVVALLGFCTTLLIRQVKSDTKSVSH